MASITLVPVGTPPQTPYTVQDNLDQLQTDLGSSDPGQGASLVGVEPIGVDNAAVLANSCYTAWVSAANTVTVRFSNYSVASQNPNASTFKVIVTK
jgi:hypothetical protein